MVVVVQMEGVNSIESLCNYMHCEKVVIFLLRCNYYCILLLLVIIMFYQAAAVHTCMQNNWCSSVSVDISISIFPNSKWMTKFNKNDVVVFALSFAELKKFAHVFFTYMQRQHTKKCKKWNTMNVKLRVIIIWCRQVPILKCK